MFDANYPHNAQEMFEQFVKARITIIVDYSYRVPTECKVLKLWAEGYAEQNHLTMPVINWAGLNVTDDTEPK